MIFEDFELSSIENSFSKSSATQPAGRYVIFNFAEEICSCPGAKAKTKTPIGNSIDAGKEEKLNFFFSILPDSTVTSIFPDFMATKNSTSSSKRVFVKESVVILKGVSS